MSSFPLNPNNGDLYTNALNFVYRYDSTRTAWLIETVSGQGQSGWSGYSGVGTSGYSGIGESGYSGIGTSGYSGIGTSGYSGQSGYSGNIGTDPTVNSITVNTTATFDEEYDNGNSGSTKTIDWTNGNKQVLTFTDNCTLTFTPPSGTCNLVLRCVQDGTGNRVATWPATVLSPNGKAVSLILSTVINAIDIVCFYWNESNYYATITKSFVI